MNKIRLATMYIKNRRDCSSIKVYSPATARFYRVVCRAYSSARDHSGEKRLLDDVIVVK